MLAPAATSKTETKTIYAIEFQATIKNGIIEIPTTYRERLPQQVRLILLGEEAPTSEDEGHSVKEEVAALRELTGYEKAR
ncbi:MAG: hypothetical protein Fur0021_31090 [Candidatus Promineifilaceae bacterium]